MFSAKRVCLAVTLVIAMASVGWGANIVVDPGFEPNLALGPFPGASVTSWYAGGDTRWNCVVTDLAPGGVCPDDIGLITRETHTGDQAARLGAPGVDDGVTIIPGLLSQDLTTGAGMYILSFWLKETGVGTSNVFFAFTVGESGFVMPVVTSAQDWTQYTQVFSATGPTTLQFTFTDDLGDILLDDVSVDTTDLPEPGTLGMIGVPLIGLALMRRRR